jgi:polyhydroxyalkanoate synthesis regulator phasin
MQEEAMLKKMISTAVKNGNMNDSLFEDFVKMLVTNGENEDEARMFLQKEVEEARLSKANAPENPALDLEYMELAAGGIFMCGTIKGLIPTENTTINLLFFAVAMACGFWGFRKMPITGLVIGFLFVLCCPYAVETYLTGRTRYINIELVIPAGLAAIPSFFAYLIFGSIEKSIREK